MIRRFAYGRGKFLISARSKAPMQSEQDRQLKREALVYQDRIGDEIFDRGFWVTENYGSHMETWRTYGTLMNLHEYPGSISIRECPLKLKNFQVSHPSTPKAPSEVRMCNLPPRDGWLLSLFEKKHGEELTMFLGKNASEKNDTSNDALRHPPNFHVHCMDLSVGSIVETIVCYITATLSDISSSFCTIQGRRASNLGGRTSLQSVQWIVWSRLKTQICPDDSAWSANLPAQLCVPGEELEKNQLKLEKSSALYYIWLLASFILFLALEILCVGER